MLILLFWMGQSLVLLFFGRMLLLVIPKFIADHGLRVPNYKGDLVPNACGLLIWLLLVAEAVALQILNRVLGSDQVRIMNVYDKELFISYVASMSAVAFVGFIDDAVGSKHVKGLGGHLRLWIETRMLSTGLLKMAAIAVAAVLFVLPQAQIGWLEGAAKILLLALMANGFNLLDLRPGRALKGFFAVCLIILTGQFYYLKEVDVLFAAFHIPYILPVIIGAGCLISPDLRGKLMLGDTGANLLGFGLGSWLILFACWQLQALLLIVFIWLHVLAWRTSISRLIERSRLLLWLDSLGRTDMEHT